MQSIEQLASCEQITEWLGLNDPRLVVATGKPAPNSGATLRENWPNHLPQADIEAAIVRLLVASNLPLSQPVSVNFSTDTGRENPRNRVQVHFASTDDWLRCFPLGDASCLPFRDENEKAWAGVAMCGTMGALAVFAQEVFTAAGNTILSNSVEARVQPVPSTVFEKIMQA